MAHKIISRAEAKTQGLKTYYTGEPCPRGHDAPRFVRGKCVECNRERNKLRPKTGKAKTGEVLAASDWRSYATKIAAAWRKTTESIIATGRLLNEAKAKVAHGDWLRLVEELPFGERTAEMLMAIADNPVLSDSNHGSDLPPSWRTLYELAKLDDQVLLARIEDHTINPGMERKEVAALLGPKRQHKRNNKPTPGESYAAMVQEIEDHKAYIAEIEAARETGFDIDGDEAALAAKIVMRIGKERTFLLIAELQKQIATAFNLEAAPTNKPH
jgi:hypothetical protein